MIRKDEWFEMDCGIGSSSSNRKGSVRTSSGSTGSSTHWQRRPWRKAPVHASTPTVRCSARHWPVICARPATRDSWNRRKNELKVWNLRPDHQRICRAQHSCRVQRNRRAWLIRTATRSMARVNRCFTPPEIMQRTRKRPAFLAGSLRPPKMEPFSCLTRPSMRMQPALLGQRHQMRQIWFSNPPSSNPLNPAGRSK